jgi:NADH:ubiquinone oxidoreductase subunit F (NADH-binding)
LPALADEVWRLASGDPAASWTRIAELAGLVDGRGACAHPDGTARLVRSMLTTFDGEVAEHLAGRCLA